MSKEKISKAKLKKAIGGSGGLIAVIAKRAGYAWQTTRDHIRADPELAQMLTDEENAVDDMAESVMIDALNAKDRSAAQWWLSRRRRTKYAESLDLTSKGEKIAPSIVIFKDADADTEDSHAAPDAPGANSNRE